MIYRWAVLAFGLMTFLSVPASAMTLTVSGTVISSDENATHPFGGGNLTGDTFSSTFQYDTVDAQPGGDQGFLGSKVTNGFVTATLTINGVSAPPPLFGNVNTLFMTANDQVFFLDISIEGTFRLVETVLVPNPQGDAVNASFTTPFSLSANANTQIGGLLNTNFQPPAAIELLATSVTLTADVAPAVPELATWAMMVIGFAGVGFLARRKPVLLAT
jgi:hypothetical protein